MKKNFKFIYIFVVLFSMLFITGCIDDSSKKVSVIVPTGTPSLGIANVLNDKTLVDANIVSGSDPLIAAFTNASYDVVVAPVNLGAKLYNANENFSYILYKTIVWGNYYLVSNEEIATLESLEGKTVLVFGKNSTPDVVLRTLISAKNINVNLEYVDDVATANSYLLSGKADIIVSAEPSLTKMSANKNFYTLDLQKQWQQLTGSYSLPQAGIFIKKDSKDEKYLKTVLVFGKNSTPDVVLRTLISAKNINVNLEYVDDVATANSYLLSGKADIIVSAEPSLTKMSANKNFYTLDLQKQWQQLTGSYSLPQAGIFIKKDSKDEKYLKTVLDKMIESVQMAQTKPNVLIASAVSVDENLAKIGEETLQKAIGNCNLRVEETDKEAIEFYFSQVIQLGIGATVGGKLPDEAFYY